MEILAYIGRNIVTLLIAWAGLRIVGKKSISQMTSYELAGVLLLTTAAAEPLVYKVPSKVALGVLVLAVGTYLLGRLSLIKKFYNADMMPTILVANGKIDKAALDRNQLNVAFLMSLLRAKGYAKFSDAEFVILEPSGEISVIPKSQQRTVKPKDLKIDTSYEGLALPLILDGEIQYNNLKYAKLNTDWLKNEVKKQGQKVSKGFF